MEEHIDEHMLSIHVEEIAGLNESCGIVLARMTKTTIEARISNSQPLMASIRIKVPHVDMDDVDESYCPSHSHLRNLAIGRMVPQSGLNFPLVILQDWFHYRRCLHDWMRLDEPTA